MIIQWCKNTNVTSNWVTFPVSYTTLNYTCVFHRRVPNGNPDTVPTVTTDWEISKVYFKSTAGTTGDMISIGY